MGKLEPPGMVPSLPALILRVDELINYQSKLFAEII